MEDQTISMFSAAGEFFPLGIVPLASARELGEKIDSHLMKWYYKENPEKIGLPERESLLIGCNCPRFTTGDAKGQIEQTVRGYDLFIVADVGNYSIRYNMFGESVPMSPDDHFQDLKRIIGAISGKAERISVIMPILYGGRQHKRSGRESLDCAMALQELENIGVKNVITFDAHDPRVQNATPFMGFDNAMPTYQVLKALFRKVRDLKIDKEHMMIVSPDEGAMTRNMYYSSELGLDLGMFYKRRDYSTVVNGRNPIVAHEYLGSSVKGKDIFVCDDILATGDSLLALCRDLKNAGCNRIFLSATYGLFTEGVEKFDDAYAKGMFDYILATNLTYRKPEVLSRPWYIDVDCSKYIAYFILAIHQNRSITNLLDPHAKVHELLMNYPGYQGN